MLKVPAPQGICTSCHYGEACPNHHGAAVMQCEQFEGAACAPSHAPHVITARPYAARGKGLCSVCWLFLSCTLPKPKGGVWQCEEYR
jgi:hypothetical protein